MIAKIRSSYRLLSTIFVLFVGLSSQQALAHAHLKVQTPAADATVSSAPKVLTLNFSEGIEPNFSGVKVTGPDNAVVKTGKLDLDQATIPRLTYRLKVIWLRGNTKSAGTWFPLTVIKPKVSTALPLTKL